MNKEMLQKCFRMTSGVDEPVTRKGFAESVEKVDPQKPGITPTDEGPDPTTTVTSLSKDRKFESDDGLDGFEYDDSMTVVGDDEPEVAVIDTDLTPDDEDDASPVDYVGKNIVVCPICLNPLFSDKAEGEIYCPICDQEVEIDHAEGVVVAPEEQVVSDQVDVDVDVTDDGEEEVVPSEEEGEGDEEQVESVKKVGLRKFGKSRESLQAPPSNKSYMDYTVDDLDSERCGGDPQKILDQYKQGLISDKNFTRYIAEGKLKECDCTKVSVCPQGGVEVTTSSAEVCVAPPEKESTLVKVDDIDTDTLDAEVNDVVSSIYGDEDITYESKNIYRQGKGFVVEGVITSKGRSKSVKLVCSESFDKRNVLRFEGFTNALGRIVLETSYNPRMKKLMTESSSYKVLVRKNGKSRVVVG